jgi:hypothetical protein
MTNEPGTATEGPVVRGVSGDGVPPSTPSTPSTRPVGTLGVLGGEMPVFEGAAELLECLRTLVRRPNLAEAPRLPDQPRPSRRGGVPLLCLIRPEDGGALIAWLTRHLTRAQPRRIPHTVYRYPSPEDDGELRLVGAAATERDVQEISDVLLAISRGLSSGSNSVHGRLRFARFGLVRWLLSQDIDVEDSDGDQVLRARLRERDLSRLPAVSRWLPGLGDVAGSLARWLRLLLLLPLLWSRLRISGRVPGVGCEYRWLVRRQPFLAPQDPGTPTGFAERLTTAQRRHEDPEQVCRLLVNAFLADLRTAYHRRPWHPRAARRTTYPVVLLDGVTRAGNGHRLLALINDVRNDTGRFDPLLVVAAGPEVPFEPGPENRRIGELIWSPERARSGYDAWCRRFAADSRARLATAWYLLLRIPPALSSGDDPAYTSAVQELAGTRALAVAPAPLWSRRSTFVALIAVLVTAVLGAGALVRHDAAAWRARHCGLSPDDPFAEWLWRPVPDGPCVGVSDGRFPFQDVDESMNEVQKTISRQNDEAWRQHRSHPERPFMTLVYLARLSTVSGPAVDVFAPRQSLVGAAAAQKEQLEQTSRGEPILQILVANAGPQMNYGPAVARMLPRMMRESRFSSIVGVVGLAESRTPTVDTIKAITAAGLPVVATTLSYDRVGSGSRLYFQVSPPNTWQASVAVAYLRYLFARRPRLERRIKILWSKDPHDVYSENLTRDLKKQLADVEPGLVPEEEGYDPGELTYPTSAPPPPTARAWGEKLCRYRGIVFWAGRPKDFGDLLDGIDDGGCARRPAHRPVILADDDTSTYAAGKTQHISRAGIPYDYLSFADDSASCPSLDRPETAVYAVFPAECKGPVRSLDGHVSLAYDAVKVYLGVARKITGQQFQLSRALLPAYLIGSKTNGTSGTILFTDPHTPGIPVRKRILVQHIDAQGRPFDVAACPDAKRAWCP